MTTIRKKLHQKNSVTKIYPHVGKKSFYYLHSAISNWNRIRKSFLNSKYLITNIQDMNGVKNIKKICSRWGSFLVTHFYLSYLEK